jgi:hypothetical protein
MTPLDRLLDRIDPEHSHQEVSHKADQALLSFTPGKATVSSWEDFRDCVSTFFCHLDNHVLEPRRPRRLHRNMDFHRAAVLLKRVYGDNAAMAAYECARTGADGGLRRVLQTIARELADEYVDHYANAVIAEYWNGLEPKEKLAAADEYLRKYGHLLPVDMTMGGAPRLRGYFLKVLRLHPKLIRRLREVRS